MSHRRKRGRPRGSLSSTLSKARAAAVAASRGATVNYCDTSVGDMDKFNKAPEPRRHVSTLFLPSSPLLSENLKVLAIVYIYYVQCMYMVLSILSNITLVNAYKTFDWQNSM